MMVEGGNLIDLGLRQSHQLGQRRQMRCRNMAIGVLDHMQVLDEQVAPQRPTLHELRNLLQRPNVNLPALGEGPGLAPSSARTNGAEPVRLRRFVHGRLPVLS
jgi:hypothetical protein